MTHTESTSPATRAELARYFLRLGLTAFGGPAAHIAMMEDDLVTRRHWLTRQHFLDMLAATQLVPGPNSTEMAIHVGYVKQGLAGLCIAGLCFIMPAFLIVLALSIAYVRYGALPATGALFYGIQPVIVAIIVQAIVRLAGSAWRRIPMLILGIASGILSLLLPIDPVLVIVIGGLIGIVLANSWPGTGLAALLLWPGSALLATSPAPLWQLALFFLKVGATLMGSGYLLISYLENDLVNRYAWLTNRQLIDAIAVGQMTPGPVFTTAAFVGYVIRAGEEGALLPGIIGAAICAAAIFLPSFFIVALIGPLVPRMRSSRSLGAFLDGVNAAVIGTMGATTWKLLQTAVLNLPNAVWSLPLGTQHIDIPALLIACVAAMILLPKKAPNSSYLIGVGAALGLLIQWLAGHV